MTEAAHSEFAAPDDALELRILSGTQAGARAPVQHGQCIGTTMDCDFILAATPTPIEASPLFLFDDAWSIGRETVQAALNQPMLFGSVWLTIARAGQPWVQAPDPIPTPTTDNADMSSEPENQNESPAPDTPQSETAAPDGILAKNPPPDRKNRVIYLSILACLLVAMAAGAALLSKRSANGTLVQGDAAAERDLAIQASIRKIDEALASLGVSDRLTAVRQANGTVLVSGWTRTAEERDKVALAMTRIWPMPGLGIQVEDEIVQRIDAALAAQRVYYDAHYMDNGKVRIEGVALDQDHLDRVLNILRTQFPGLTVDSSPIMLADDVQKRLLGKLLAAGFTDASLAWQEKKLVVTATVQNRAQYSALQALIADFNNTHGPIARLSASGDIDNRDAPFEIRTIVSGAQPYIVLANGQKILVGGSHDGYRLEAIEPRRIILQSDERIVIER